MNLIQILEQEEMARVTAGKTIPSFRAGDTVVVNVNVVDSSFIVRKISSGEGVERTFQLYAPTIASIEVKRYGDVCRSKLYYLRDRSGKAARIKELLVRKN